MQSLLNRRAVLFGAPAAFALAGCSGEPVWAPQSAVDASIYRGTGPKALTLITVKNTSSGNGAHTALLVDASQRVLFDPAGSFKAKSVPERNDVLFGVSPLVEQAYLSFHARRLFYIDVHKVEVAPDVAEQALQLVMAQGAVPKANCTRTTSAIIRQLPGFADIGQTWFPNKLAEDFGKIPGVTMETIREDD